MAYPEETWPEIKKIKASCGVLGMDHEWTAEEVLKDLIEAMKIAKEVMK